MYCFAASELRRLESMELPLVQKVNLCQEKTRPACGFSSPMRRVILQSVTVMKPTFTKARKVSYKLRASGLHGALTAKPDEGGKS